MKTRISLTVAIVAITLTVGLLILSATYLNIPLYISLLVGYIIAFLISVFYKVEIRELIKGSVEGIKSIAKVFLILILIGILISIWSASGTIDTLVYYGLSLINPEYLIIVSFIASAFVSMLLGTSVGTASTVGIAFMGMAESLGINSGIVAGAIVSGAFVGDRTSPLSSAALINATVTETDYYDNLKELLKTLIPVLIITGLIYFLIGKNLDIQGNSSNVIIEDAKIVILSNFNTISLILLIPPMVLMALAIFKIPIRTNLIIGILIAAILAYIFQRKEILDLFKYAIFGYDHPNGQIYGGGWKMLNQIFLIVIAGAYYGLMEISGMLAVLLERLTKSITSSITLINNTIIISLSSALLTSTQIMSILIPGKVMLQYYKSFNIDKKILNRTISDSGMIVSGLIPWNLNAILLGIALNISVIEYIPYAYLLMLLPIYSYIFSRLEQKKKINSRILAKNNE